MNPPDLLARAFAAMRDSGPAEGLALAEEATRAMPSDARAHALVARGALALGDVARAEAAIERALTLDPASIPAWIERSALARMRGDPRAMREALMRLVELAPQHTPFRIDLASHWEQSGDFERAEAELGAAIARAPDAVDARLARATLRFRRGQLGAALEDVEFSLRLDPWHQRALSLSGELLMRLGRPAEAVPRVQCVTLLAPKDWVPQDALLRAMKQAGYPTPAVLAQAEKLGATLGGAFGKCVVAVEQMVQGGPEAGAATVTEALAIDPKHPMALWLAMQVPPSMVHEDEQAEAAFLDRWRERLALLETLDPAAIDPTMAQAMLYAASSFYVHYLGEPLVDELGRLGRLVTKLASRAAGAIPEHRRPDDGRLRVGVATGMLRHHTITKLFGALLRKLDRPRFEVTLIHTGGVEDELTRELVAGADAYVRVPGSLAEVARAVRARDLDLIVWLDIGMETSGAALAALRLAPTQAVLWGHPVTTGLPSIDVFLTAASMEPTDGERHYTEHLHRLPGLGTCYAAPIDRAITRPAELSGKRPAGVLAFMPQLVQKLRPRFDRALARIAAGSPELRFLMTPYFLPTPVRRYRERLARAFAAYDIALDERLVLCRWVTQAEWLGLAQLADFGLDAFDWSGGNTSLEMFWFDTPIVTLPGALMRGRHTLAMLERMELTQLIARDEDDYVRIATALANSSDFRAEMTALVRERKHRLYDDRTVADAFVDFCARQAAIGRDRRLKRDAQMER